MHKTLVSLDEHNKLRTSFYKFLEEASSGQHKFYNGIACPECGKETFDAQPCMSLPSNPPKKRIGCDCGFTGFRVS